MNYPLEKEDLNSIEQLLAINGTKENSNTIIPIYDETYSKYYSAIDFLKDNYASVIKIHVKYCYAPAYEPRRTLEIQTSVEKLLEDIKTKNHKIKKKENWGKTKKILKPLFWILGVVVTAIIGVYVTKIFN